MKFLAVILLIIALILEASVTTIPLILTILLCFTVVYRENWIFLFAFVFGLLFDLFSFKTPGVSSAFYVVFIYLILLYQRKFEIATGYFVLGSVFLGSLVFLFLMDFTNNIILQSVVASFFAAGLFKIMQKKNSNKTQIQIFNN